MELLYKPDGTVHNVSIKTSRHNGVSVITVEELKEQNGERVLDKTYYTSLDRLIQVWGVPSAPQKYYFLHSNGFVGGAYGGDDSEQERYRKVIGNYFRRRSEVEEANNKLCALQRLKAKGFRFEGCYEKATEKGTLVILARLPHNADPADYKLLFGGDDECEIGNDERGYYGTN